MPDAQSALEIVNQSGTETIVDGFPKSLPLMERSLPAEDMRLVKSDDGYTRLTFSVSSEAAVARYYGDEILSHSDGAIREDRLKRGAVMYLFNHDANDPIGVVEGYRIQNKKLVVDVKFFKTSRAEEISTMVDGGMRNVSLLYRIHVVEEDVKKQRYTITDWEPYEVSAVTIPADPSVGVGRSLVSDEKFEVRMSRTTTDVITPAQPAKLGVTIVPEDNQAAAGASAERTSAPPRIEAGQQHERPNGVQIEQGRVAAIRNLSKINKIDERTVEYWVANGISMEGVSEDMLRIMEERGKSNPQSAAALGMSKGDANQFSLARAINACATNDWKLAPFELDCSRQIAQKLNKPVDTQHFFVPFEVLQRDMGSQRRDLTSTTPGSGGYLIATENQGFIEILRNRSVAFRMGARRLSGLNGNVTIPKQTGAGTAYWLATDASTVTESEQAFQQIALTPKTASAYTEISRNLLLQSSPGAEGIVSDDLAQITALAVDLAALTGSGAAGQPTGVANTTGIGSVTATSVDYAKVLEFQTDVATSNVTPVRGGYVTTPAAAAVLMAKQRFTSTDTPLWQGNVWDGTMVGFPAMSSNQLSAGMLFGDWSELVIGEWGVLEIAVNPYASFQAGIIGVRAMYSMDVGVRRAFAFSYASSVTA